MKTLLKIAFKTIKFIFVAAIIAWALLILIFGPWPLELNSRLVIAGGLLVYLGTVKFYCRPKYSLIYLTTPLLAIFIYFYSLQPTATANWTPDNARMPHAEIIGDLLRIKDVRNFNYRSETDFDVNYYDRSYDLKKLEGVDLLLSYWGDPRIAHVLITFRFTDKKYLTFSIETRKKVGQQYSAVKGFFRNYGLIYIAADEQDIVKLRTNYRKEDVYLYHLITPPERARLLLLNYIQRIQSLEATPEFYNAATNNCTTNVFYGFKSFRSFLKFNYKVLLSGYFAELGYDLGALYKDVPFSELQKISYITPKAQALPPTANFSKEIRKGLPFPNPHYLPRN